MHPMTTETGRPADPRLLDWLVKHGVDHEVHHHRSTMTASETARAEGVDPRTFAKTVIVATSDGRRALLALEANDRVDLVKARQALATTAVHLISENELIELAPGGDPGAWPPVGELFGMPVLADHALRDAVELTFSAGSHDYAVQVDRAAWERAAGTRYVDIAEDRLGEPVWMR